MKKIVVSFCLLVLLVSVHAFCGGTTEEEQKPVTITWSFWNAEPVETIKAFHESHPNIIVQYEQIASDQYLAVLNTRLMAGEAPDLFATRSFDIYETLVKEGRVIDLTDEPFMDNYQDSVRELVKAADGRNYGMTMTTLGLLGYYNKDMFDKLNLEAPTNWEEHLEVSRVLKENGIAPQIQGMKDLWQNQFIVHPEAAMNLIDNTWVEGLETGESKYTDPECVEVFERLQLYYEKGYVHEGCIGLTFIQAWQLFCQGEAGMMAGGSFYAGQAFPQAEPEFEWGLYNLVNNIEGQPSYMPTDVRVALTVINAEGHIDESLIFFEWFSQPENLAILAKDLQTFSPGKGITGIESPVSQALYDYMSVQETVLWKQAPNSIMSVRLKALQDMLVGAKTAQEACEEIQRNLDASLAN